MPRSRVHVITGEQQMVRAALTRAWSDGRLVSMEPPLALPGGRVRVLAHLRPPAPQRRWELVRVWLVRVAKFAAVLAVLAAVAGVVWLVVLAVLEVIALVTAAVAWIHAHLALLLVGGVALLFVLGMAVSGGDRCAGLHCGGCRR